MILKKLSEFIIIDDIRREAVASELYFLSHLMDHEMLVLPDNWPARIYTSKFIFDVIGQKMPDVQMNSFRILHPNLPVKLRSKDKTIMVTMFETGEITHNVMFYFEDKNATHLYSGVFTEVNHLYLNKYFRRVLNKGIDYIYIDATRCRGKSFVFTDDTINEISQIYTSNPNRSMAVVIPDFGYEAFLVSLLKQLPQAVYPTNNQRKVLTKLGYGKLIGEAIGSGIKIHPPGITADHIQIKNLLTIYLAEAKPSTSACGIQICQWSPYPSVMNLQELLEMTRPKVIVPIKKVPLEEKISLPPSFKFFLGPRTDEEMSHVNLLYAGDSSLESVIDLDSDKSYDSICDLTADSTSAPKPLTSNRNTELKQTRINLTRTKQHSFTSSEQKTTAVTSTNVRNKECGPAKNRTRVIYRPQEFQYEDSDSV